MALWLFNQHCIVVYSNVNTCAVSLIWFSCPFIRTCKEIIDNQNTWNCSNPINYLTNRKYCRQISRQRNLCCKKNRIWTCRSSFSIKVDPKQCHRYIDYTPSFSHCPPFFCLYHFMTQLIVTNKCHYFTVKVTCLQLEPCEQACDSFPPFTQ